MAAGGERAAIAWPSDEGAPRPAGDGAVCVGFSGGLDSTFLLHALHATARAEGRVLTAVHVHHGLSPNADAWAASCADACGALGIPLDIVRVQLDRASGRGLEAEARHARYAVYAARPEPFVALAHHRDDQAETVLLQLLRGTGLKGVAAMPRLRPLNERVTLYRPLLALSRREIEVRATASGLRWIADESNASIAPDRNFVRHEMGPRLDERFPAWRDALARFAARASEAQALLDDLAVIDGLPNEAGAALPLDPALPPRRRANLLRAFLARNGLAMPSEARLAEMARQLYESRDDALVRVAHDEAIVTRHRGHARIEDEAPSAWRVEWHGEPRVELGEGLGEVHFESSVGSGISAAQASQGEWHLASRGGGERLRLAPGRPTRTLKNLLQERGLTPAERSRLPLLFHGERLVWVPGIGIAAEYACAPGQAGLKPLWRVAGKTPLC